VGALRGVRTLLGSLSIGCAACTTPPVEPGVPRIAERVVVLPYQVHDQCFRLAPGERLDWRYESTQPLAFSIHYHENNAELATVVRDASTSDSGTFEALSAQNYCLSWESGPPGAIIGYRLLLRPSTAR
jgi:hypothetical protein